MTILVDICRVWCNHIFMLWEHVNSDICFKDNSGSSELVFLSVIEFSFIDLFRIGDRVTFPTCPADGIVQVITLNSV